MSENKAAEELKDLGNEAFNNGEYKEAIDYYTKALELNPIESIKSAIYKNRSMVKLKLEDYEGAEYDCVQGIFFICNDITVFSFGNFSFGTKSFISASVSS